MHIEYSYALYIPNLAFLVAIAHSPYWLLFDSVTLFNKSGYQSDKVSNYIYFCL